MALPENFSEWEHLQDMIRREHNKAVQEYFKHEEDNDISTPRSALKHACLIKDEDTATMTQIRLYLFFEMLGYGKNNLMRFYDSRDNQAPPVTGHPKIYFYFSQDAQSVPNEDYKADAEYSVRLMTLENTSSNLHSKLMEIANEIKTQFVEAKRGIVLTKGNLSVSYIDKIHGFDYASKILTNNESDAIDIYRRMCNVIDAPFDEMKITVNNPKRPSTVGLSTSTQVIMGKTRKKPAYRRVVNVRFRYSYAEIPGEPNPVFLVDTTYRYNPLVKI